MDFFALTDPVTPEYLTDVLGWECRYGWAYISPHSLFCNAGITCSRNLKGLYNWHLFGIEIPALPTVGHLLALCWALQIPIPRYRKGACK